MWLRIYTAYSKKLKEREDEFTRKVNLYESNNPSLGKDSDVLHLNVGGSHITVLRRTLTQFKDSVLAAQFSVANIRLKLRVPIPLIQSFQMSMLIFVR